MANYIEYNNNVSINRFTTASSRYKKSKLIYYTDNKYITFTTYKKSKNNSTDNKRYMVISKNFEYRPDLVSFEAYGVVDFWWRIMEFNNIKDIFDFKAGLNITIPEQFFG